jgi:hypothetical protein
MKLFIATVLKLRSSKTVSREITLGIASLLDLPRSSSGDFETDFLKPFAVSVLIR